MKKKVIIATLVAGIVVGTTVGHLTTIPEEYGAYNPSLIKQGIQIEWTADSNQFKPIDCKLSKSDQEFIYYLCEAYNLDFTFVMAVIGTESGFKADTISATDDYGLMQINKCNHKWMNEKLGINNFLDAKENAKAGMYILKTLSEKYSNPKEVLMAYNMGEAGAKALWDSGIHDTSYTDKVLARQKELNNETK